jgi:ketosteroid isomerase-like protein
MNTQPNIAFVQKAYADFLAGDIGSILAALTDDIEWTTPGKGVPTEGARHGKAEVAKFFQAVAETWNFTAFQPREYIASDDTVAVIGSYTAIALATGNSMSSEWVMVWKIRDGKLARFREYTDTQALAEAVSVRAAA